MKVRVPVSIAGGSLLNAHNWVKSTIAKSNPGGSTDNYKIQSTDGTPLSLSDLTTQSFDEVFVLSGPRSNPGKVYPFPTDSHNYPTYDSKRLVGNDYAAILGKDVDASMVERLIAQNGVFSGLNTLTKLLYTMDSTLHTASDPDVAAIIQSYSNAQQKKGTRSNPGRPFFARGINDEFRGVLSPEEAVKTFVEGKYGVLPGKHSMPFTTAIDKARIVRMYGLQDDNNVENFLDHVLAPYLAVSIPNANFLKVLRSQDYYGEMQKYTMKLRGKDKTSNVEDSVMWKKLVSLTPMTSKDFYEGKDFAFVANPYFARTGLGQAMLSKAHVAELMKIVEKHPEGVLDEITSGVETADTLLDKIFGVLTGGNSQLAWEAAASQGKILAEGDNPQEILDNLRAIYQSEASEDQLAKAFKEIKLLPKEKGVLGVLEVRRGLGGFRPTAPPFWPKPVVLSLMDVLRDNMNLLLSNGSFNAGQAFLDLSHRDPDDRELIKVANLPNRPRAGDSNKYFSIPFGYMEHLVNKLVEMSDVDVAKIFEGIGDNNSTNKDMEPDRGLLSGMDRRRESAGQTFEDTPNMNRIKHLVAERNLEFIEALSGNVSISQAKKLKALAKQELQRHRGQINSEAIEENTSILGLLSLFMEIEETSRNKYDYTMTENDRAFALFLLEMVFIRITETVESASMELVDPDDPKDIERMAKLIAQMSTDDEKLSKEDIQNRVHFELHMKKISTLGAQVFKVHETLDKSSVQNYIRKATKFEEGDILLPGWANKRFHDVLSNINGPHETGADKLEDHTGSDAMEKLHKVCVAYSDWMMRLKQRNPEKPLGEPYLPHPTTVQSQVDAMKDVKIVFDGGKRIAKDLQKQTSYILRRTQDAASNTRRNIRKIYDIVDEVDEMYGLQDEINFPDLLWSNRKKFEEQLPKVLKANRKYLQMANKLQIQIGTLENNVQQLEDAEALLEEQIKMRSVNYDNLTMRSKVGKFNSLIGKYKKHLKALQKACKEAIQEIEKQTESMTREEMSYERFPHKALFDRKSTNRYDLGYWRITSKMLLIMPKAYDAHELAAAISGQLKFRELDTRWRKGDFQPETTGETGESLLRKQGEEDKDVKGKTIRPKVAQISNKGRKGHTKLYANIWSQMKTDFGDVMQVSQSKDFRTQVVKRKGQTDAEVEFRIKDTLQDGRKIAHGLSEKIRETALKEWSSSDRPTPVQSEMADTLASSGVEMSDVPTTRAPTQS